jgi:1,4-dihydroxy-2-naphthoate polyprenyltransferase
VLHRSTIQLLRFHFSLFLLPVFLYAISELRHINWKAAIAVFVVLHLVVYPSSNGYNSYMDRDESPIGGLANPLQPTRQLFLTTIIMDLTALIFSLYISPYFAMGILLYILASRAYSYRGIRLKRYPIIGFLTVFIFQGALMFFISYHALHPQETLLVPLLPCLISSLLIGALYPLTQIYQHEEDKRDGVVTISYLLGKRGSFLFSAFLFMTATFLFFLRFHQQQEMNFFYLYLLVMFPVVLFFLYWMWRVWKDSKTANFKNSLLLNVIATFCMTLFFIVLIILKN